MEFRVHPVTELIWPFEGEPHFNATGGYYQRQERVDPFPCYAHPTHMVEAITVHLNEAMPLDGVCDVYLPAWEVVMRTNGHASPQTFYKDDETDNFGGTIVLSGKRIPLHPAMTRYLTSHEYGHVVQYWVEKRFNTTNLITAYAKDLRCYKTEQGYYGGRTWHATPGEMFANDFRICAAGYETEFWPHEGFAHPHSIPQVVEFWKRAKSIGWESALAMLSILERK